MYIREYTENYKTYKKTYYYSCYLTVNCNSEFQCLLKKKQQETAIQIAYAARLFSQEEIQEPLIINAASEETTKAELDRAKDKMLADVQQDLAENNRMGSQVTLFSRSISSLYSLTDERERRRFALVIDGTTLSFATSDSLKELFLSVCKHCHSVVCCRATPIQKVLCS